MESHTSNTACRIEIQGEFIVHITGLPFKEGKIFLEKLLKKIGHDYDVDWYKKVTSSGYKIIKSLHKKNSMTRYKIKSKWHYFTTTKSITLRKESTVCRSCFNISLMCFDCQKAFFEVPNAIFFSKNVTVMRIYGNP